MVKRKAKKIVVKKQVKYNGGGFDEHPEHINKDGRPDAGYTWRETYIREVEKNSEKRKGYTKKESIAAKDVEMAEGGRIAHSKEVKDRMEGKPPISAGRYGEDGEFEKQDLVVVYGKDD